MTMDQDSPEELPGPETPPLTSTTPGFQRRPSQRPSPPAPKSSRPSPPGPKSPRPSPPAPDEPSPDPDELPDRPRLWDRLRARADQAGAFRTTTTGPSRAYSGDPAQLAKIAALALQGTTGMLERLFSKRAPRPIHMADYEAQAIAEPGAKIAARRIETPDDFADVPDGLALFFALAGYIVRVLLREEPDPDKVLAEPAPVAGVMRVDLAAEEARTDPDYGGWAR